MKFFHDAQGVIERYVLKAVFGENTGCIPIIEWQSPCYVATNVDAGLPFIVEVDTGWNRIRSAPDVNNKTLALPIS